ncbi:MAG: ATP-dependent protease ATPase subunit HslU [Clostridia bacterium]|nr:ATP-dependent protease ATPase subunit HslU [Clostridia bacterium]
MDELTPKQIVSELNRYIIGQEEAKKAVAIALRNRYRRSRLEKKLQEEITPKNIVMIGPTGVGKTEIARRLAKLVKAPFIKVEATKFTEVGYVGRDVESMIRDLVEESIRMQKNEKMKTVMSKAQELALQRIANILLPYSRRKKNVNNPLEALFGTIDYENDEQGNYDSQEKGEIKERRIQLKKKLATEELDSEYIEIEVEDTLGTSIDFFSNMGNDEININMQDVFGNLFPKKKKKRRVTIKEAKKILAQQEAQKLIDMDEVNAEAIDKAEQHGIIFLDEIDKIAGKDYSGGPDVSREGVQRDILPIVEGSTVMTKYGPVKTDHILFIAAGAFHVAKISDLIPELQGRFPIRVKLNSLNKEHFKQILTKTENAVTKQYIALMNTEGVNIEFTEDSIDEIANIAYIQNEQMEDIGARRLYTVFEKLLQDISFDAPDIEQKDITIDRDYVVGRFKDDISNRDIERYII